MVAFWPEKCTNNFVQYYFTSQIKLRTGFIAKICQTSYACLRPRSDYILLTSAWGTSEEFADHQQNICNSQLCSLRPLEVLLARKSAKVRTPSFIYPVQGNCSYLEATKGLNNMFSWGSHFGLRLSRNLLGSHYLSTTTWRTIFQGGDRECFLMALRTFSNCEKF